MSGGTTPYNCRSRIMSTVKKSTAIMLLSRRFEREREAALNRFI
jgi:hypothetical protein